MPEVKRQTAYKCSVKMILDGNYVQKPGWDPNYVESNGMQISRANILAVIVSREGNSFTLDDGTGQIQVMSFGEDHKFKDMEVGDVVLVIARPREYNQRRFLVPEIVKKIENRKWIDYRKAELGIGMFQESEKNNEKQTKQTESKPKETKIKKIPDEDAKALSEKIKLETGFEDNYASIILSTIRKLDKGDGAGINDIIKQSGLEKAEKYIKSLINEGEIFEIRTGKIKILS